MMIAQKQQSPRREVKKATSMGFLEIRDIALVEKA
jgi:hypothetical protein